jgi:hypothetical protein
MTERRTPQSTQSSQSELIKLISACLACSAVIVVTAGCGQKGPPLPPIVRTPVPPGVNVNRRGSTIELAVTVPNVNTDGSRPANIAGIDVYAMTSAPPTMADADIVKHGTKVASVAVKSPRSPNDTVEQGESPENVEPTVGEGLEQGSTKVISESITASVVESNPPDEGPLVGSPGMTELRTYLVLGVDRRGRPVQSKRVTVPLQLAPPPPPPVAIAYDEKKIAITWKPNVEENDAVDKVLPSRSLGPLFPDVAYNIYDGMTGARLNDKPILEQGYEDTRMEWGTMRCYFVRAMAFVARLPVESDPTETACEMLVDTFQPAAPRGLTAVPTEGAINLIWDPNSEPDLAGYLVMRAMGDEPLQQLTPKPITDASFKDDVKAGLHFTYAVSAVDKAGNVSALSNRVEESAR